MHVIVCGLPRTGTTLLYNMLRTTVKNFEFYDSELSALRFISDEEPDGVNRVTKRPLDFMRAGHFEAFIPDVKFIVCVRDPRSILCSMHWHSDTEYKVSWDKSIHSVKENGKLREMQGLIEMDRGLLRITKPHYVYFEQLITQPDRVQTRLGRLFNFEYEGVFDNFHKHEIPELLSIQMNGVRPLDVSRLKPWVKHKERIIQQFEECPYLHELLYKYKYEMDQTWYSMFKNTG